jgi:hypothetical protein
VLRAIDPLREQLNRLPGGGEKGLRRFRTAPIRPLPFPDIPNEFWFLASVPPSLYESVDAETRIREALENRKKVDAVYAGEVPETVARDLETLQAPGGRKCRSTRRFSNQPARCSAKRCAMSSPNWPSIRAM